MSSSSGAVSHSSGCQCSKPSSSQILNVAWRSVPLSAGTNLAFTGLKILSWTLAFPVTLAAHASGNGYKDNTHDCVEIHMICDQCKNKCYVVIEMDSDGKHMYNKYYSGSDNNRNFNCNPGALTFGDVWRVYQDSFRYPSWNKDFNCGHYAQKVYWDLYRA